MSSKSDNPQIAFWRGAFGSEYIERNSATEARVRALIPLWSRILAHTISSPPRSILEVGPNIGLNLRALRFLSEAKIYAVEPNDRAREILVRDGVIEPAHLRSGAALSIDFPNGVADFAFTSGVLIHIHPDDLLASCREIYRCSERWIACIEYFSDTPEHVHYRGHNEMLFKRDFGGFWLDNFPDLRAVSYGFIWKRATGLDNCNWWLFQKP